MPAPAKLALYLFLCLPAAFGAEARPPTDLAPQTPAGPGTSERTSKDKKPGEERPLRARHDHRLENKPQEMSATTAIITRVVDGDTIEADYRGAIVDIRLIGIDTPETVHPSQPVECFGPAASRFTTTSLTGDTVRLEFDLERRDRYGRRLAYVWHEGRLFNRILVRRGLATVSTYPPNDRYVDRFTAAERQAKAANQGLWGACSVPAPTTGEEHVDSGAAGCDGYSPCLEPASDYDCSGGSGNGPRFARGPIEVTGSDPYELDSDGDGVACEPTY